MRCPMCGEENPEGTSSCRSCKIDISNYLRVQQHLKKAERYQKDFEFDRAIEECTIVFRLDSKNQRAKELIEDLRAKIRKIKIDLELADGYFHEHKYKEAIEYLDNVLLLFPTNEDAKKKRELAALLLSISQGHEQTPEKTKGIGLGLKFTLSLSIFLIPILIFLIIEVTRSHERKLLNEEAARKLYIKIKETVAQGGRRDSAEFLTDYLKLIEDYRGTKHARITKEELPQIYKEYSKRFDIRIKIYMFKAQRYLDEGRYELAKNECQKVLEIDPKHIQVLDLIKKAEEKIAWERKSPKEKARLKFGEYYNKGRRYEDQGDLKAAIAAYEGALEYKPNDQNTQDRISYTKEKLSEQEKMKEANYQKWYIEGKGHFEARDWDKAIEQLTKALTYKDKKKTEALLKEARQYKDEALRLAKEEGDTEKLTLEVQRHLSLGEKYFKERRYHKALIEWQGALELDPSQKQMLDSIIEKTKDIIAYEKRKEDETTLRFQEYYNKGKRCEDERDFKSAIEAYESALAYKSGDYVTEERLRYLREILTQRQKRDTAYERWHRKGEGYLRAEDWDRAVRAFKRALSYRDERGGQNKLTRARYEKNFSKAEELEGRKRWATAIDYYRKANGLIEKPEIDERIKRCQNMLSKYGVGHSKKGLIIWTWSLVCIYVSAFGFLFSLAITPLIKKFAEKMSIFGQIPGGETNGKSAPRSAVKQSHSGARDDEKPVRAGGIALSLSLILSICFSSFIVFVLFLNPALTKLLSEELILVFPEKAIDIQRLLLLLTCGILAMLIGLADDFKKISSHKLKILAQVLLGCILVSSGFNVPLFTSAPLLNGLVTVGWMVLIMNVFYLIDNIDGLVCGIAVICAGVFIIVNLSTGQSLDCILMAIFLGSLLGFLRYNFIPASISLGSSGSLFVGYFLGIFTIMNTEHLIKLTQATTLSLLPILVFSLPILDVLSVSYMRMRKQSLMIKDHRRYLCWRLISWGMSKRGAVFFVYLITAYIGIDILLIGKSSLFYASLILLEIFSIAIIAVIRKEFLQRKRMPSMH